MNAKTREHERTIGERSKGVKPSLRIRPRTVAGAGGKTYTYWALDLGTLDGKRRIRTFSTKAEAEREAERITKQERRIGADAKRLTDDDLHALAEALAIVEGGARLPDVARFWRTYAPHEAEIKDALAALEILARRVSLVDAATFYIQHGAGEGGEITVAELYARFMEEKASRNLAEKTLKDLRARLAKFVAEHGETKAHQITVRDLETWLRQFDGLVHRDNNRRCLANLFNYAVRRDFIQRNPVDRIEPPKKSHAPPAVLSVDDAANLMRSAEQVAPAMVPYFALALFAGLRPESEILRMDWSRINFDEQVIDVPGAYSKLRHHRRNVEMADNLLRWLEPHRRDSGPIYFKRREYDAIRKAAKLGSERCAIDIMRHSYGTYHHEHFRDLARTAKNMGDNARTIEARYVNLVKPSAAAAYWKIEPARA